MTKVRKKIGNIPINTIKQDLQSTVDSSVAQMQQDVTDFIDEETAQYPEIGGAFKFQEDPEGRSEITTDSEGKIISYRDADGVKHEEVGIKANRLDMTRQGLSEFYESLKEEGILAAYNAPNLPKFGYVNIVSETFYLTSHTGYTDKNGVYIIRDYIDNDANADQLITLDYFYVKSTLIDNGDGTYSKYNDGVTGHDVKLDFYAASKVTKINDEYYVTSSLVEGQPTENSIKVTQITDVPDINAWPVDKKTEHYCSVEINFGYYLSGTFNIGIKYQGSSTLHFRKKNFRFTFYKNSSYSKKDKIKIGEMIRLSGFNLKANRSDITRVKELILYRFVAAVWENRPEYDRYPWDKEFTPYTSANGTIKGFPVEVNIGGDFYGLDVFGLKKDGKNFLLTDADEETDATGLLVCGNGGLQTDGKFVSCWQPIPENWDEELNDEEFCTSHGHTETDTNALIDFLSFINSDSCTKETMPQRMDIIGWIDYFILMQVFIMFDNTARNLMLYSNAERRKFWPFFYDLDLAWWTTAGVPNVRIAIDADILTPGTTYFEDLTLWQKLWDIFRDEIITRYEDLRKTVLNTAYIKAIYHDIIVSIPPVEFSKESAKWETVNIHGIENNIRFLNDRLEWLDKNYFIK